MQASMDPEKLLALLRDPNVGSEEVSAAAGVPRPEAARAARMAHGLAKAALDEVLSLPAPLAAALVRGGLEAGRADLAAAAASSAAREVAKEGKRALHILRTRGVAVPEAPRP